MSSTYLLRQPHISNIVLLSEPNTVAAWKWNHLSFWRFSLCRSNFLSNLRPIPVMRPIMVLSVFPLFCSHFGCLWVLPNLTVSFSTPIMALSTLQKHCVLKENAQFWREKYYKVWEKQKDKWFHFHACTSQHTHIFQRFCALGTHTTCIFGTWVAQQVDSVLRPANSPKHAPNADVQLMWERVLCNSSAINSPNIFLCNRLRGMSLHISEN